MTPPNLSVKRRLDLCDRLAEVAADERFNAWTQGPRVREFIVAVFLARLSHETPKWRTVGSLTTSHLSAYEQFREAVRYDVPRWQPIEDGCGCEHVLQSGPRKGETCGKYAHLRFSVTDPGDGTWRTSSWCSKHVIHGQELQWRESRRDKTHDPKPGPNVGGLLPCYMCLPKVEGMASWEDAYRSVSRPGWEPPSVGVCADDWSTMRKVHGVTAPRRPKLSLIVGGLS